MNTQAKRAAIACVVAAVVVWTGACYGRDNIIDPEFDGSVTIEGPDRITGTDPVRYRVRVEPEQPDQHEFLWSSENPSVVRVLSNGEALPVSEGSTRIRATYFGPGAEELDVVAEKTVTVVF